MQNLGKLKDIAIQDEPNNVQAIFADDVSVINIVQTVLAFISFFLIILTLGIFAPKESEVVCTTLALNPNTDKEDVFTSIVTNISSINQKLRISILYDNATLETALSYPLNTHITVNMYDSQNTKVDSVSFSDSIQYNRPVPLFQTSILNFEKLELKASIDANFDTKHSATLKYEYVSSEATFFQLKIRAILSIISISTFIFMVRTMSRTFSQTMTLFLHVASFFIFNPLQILYNYFPTVIFLCFDFIFKNVGLAYVYIYSNVIFFTFEKNLNKFTIVTNVFLFFLLLFILVAKDFNSLFESYPTIYPAEFNSVNYNANKFTKEVKLQSKTTNAESVYKQTVDLALKLAFVNSTTIEETNLNLSEFSFLMFLFFLPIIASILYSIFNVEDVYFHRIIVFAVTIATFAIGLTNFFAMDVIGGYFHGRLIRWILPLASLSTFTLVFTFLNMEDDRNLTYENVGSMDEAMIDGDAEGNGANELGLEEDDEQIKRKEMQKRNESKK